MQINMVSSGEDLLSDQLQRGPIPDRENHSLHQTHVSETHAFHSDQEVRTPVLSGKELMLRDSGHSLRSNEQRSISSITTDRASEIVHALQTDQEVITPTMREKVSEDGYNWRKYGQKLVRGNEFVRSYYKCTHPRCQAKKQLDCTHEGQIVETICFGDHFHAKVPNLPRAVGMVVSVVEEKLDNSSSTIAKDKSSGRHGQTPRQNEPTENPRLAVTAASDNVQASPLQSNRVKDDVDNDDKLGSKRRKKENSNTNVPLVERTIGDHRVVQTLSEVDFVDDGYRWRKYGQKLVKGNPNPRNYYRCSNSGCPAKKHVERASHDPKLVITSYEGQHDHDMPPSRTVTPNVAGKSPKEAQYRESAAKVEHEAGCPGTNVHAGSDQLSKSTEGKNDDPKNESEATAVVRLDKAKQSIFYPESRSHEPQNGKSGTVEGSDIAHHSMCHKDETKNLRNCESEIKSEHDGTASHVKVIHATSCPETSFGEQEQSPKTPKTEAAQS